MSFVISFLKSRLFGGADDSRAAAAPESETKTLNDPLRPDDRVPLPTAPAAELQGFIQDHTYVAPTPSLLVKFTDEDCVCAIAGAKNAEHFDTACATEISFIVVSKGLYNTPCARMTCGIVLVRDATAHRIRGDVADPHLLFPSYDLIGFGSRDGVTMGFFNGPARRFYPVDQPCDRLDTGAVVTIRVSSSGIAAAVNGKRVVCAGLDSVAVERDLSYYFAAACLDAGQAVAIGAASTLLAKANDAAGLISAFHAVFTQPILPAMSATLSTPATRPASLSFGLLAPTRASVAVDTSGKIALCHAAPRSAEGATLVTNEYLPTDASWTAVVHLNPNRAFLPASADLGTMYVGLIGFPKDTDRCPYSLHHVGHKAFDRTPSFAIQLAGDALSLISAGEVKWTALPPRIPGASSGAVAFRYVSDTGAITVRVSGSDGKAVDCFRQLPKLAFLPTPRYWRLAVTFCKPGQSAFIGTNDQWDDCVNHDSCRTFFKAHEFLACRFVSFPSHDVTAAHRRDLTTVAPAAPNEDGSPTARATGSDPASVAPGADPASAMRADPVSLVRAAPAADLSDVDAVLWPLHFFSDPVRTIQVNATDDVALCVADGYAATIATKETVRLNAVDGTSWTAQFSIVAVNGAPLDSPQSTTISGPMFFGFVGEQPTETWCRPLGDPAIGPCLGIRCDGGRLHLIVNGQWMALSRSDADVRPFTAYGSPIDENVGVKPNDVVRLRVDSDGRVVFSINGVCFTHSEMRVPSDLHCLRFAVSLTTTGQCVALHWVPLRAAAEFRDGRCAAQLAELQPRRGDLERCVGRSRLDLPGVQWSFLSDEGALVAEIPAAPLMHRILTNVATQRHCVVTRECVQTNAPVAHGCEACGVSPLIGSTFECSACRALPSAPLILCEQCFHAHESFVPHIHDRSSFVPMNGGSVFDFSVRVGELAVGEVTSIGIVPAAQYQRHFSSLQPGTIPDSAGLAVSATAIAAYASGTRWWSDDADSVAAASDTPRRGVRVGDTITVRLRRGAVFFILNGDRILCRREGFLSEYRFAITFGVAKTGQTVLHVLPTPYVAIPLGSVQEVVVDAAKLNFESRFCNLERPKDVTLGQQFRVVQVDYDDMAVRVTEPTVKRGCKFQYSWLPIAALQRVAYAEACKAVYGVTEAARFLEAEGLTVRHGDRVWPHYAHWRGGAAALESHIAGVVQTVNVAVRTCVVRFDATDVLCRFGYDGYFDVLPDLTEGDTVVRCPTGWIGHDDDRAVGDGLTTGTVLEVFPSDRTVTVQWVGKASLVARYRVGDQHAFEVQRWIKPKVAAVAAVAAAPTGIRASAPAAAPLATAERRTCPQLDLSDFIINRTREARLGKGGFGVVWKWWWKGQNIFVAVKEAKEITAAQLEQQRKELRIMSMFRHRNIVTTYGWAQGDPTISIDGGESLFIIMELVQPPSATDRAITLDAYVQSKKQEADRRRRTLTAATGGTLGWNDFFDIMTGIAEALAYMHGQYGCFHRDIKPANILLDRVSFPGCVIAKVSDFGLSAILPEGQSTVLEPNAVGTLAYLPPEVFDRGHVGHRSDIYAVGVVMWEVLTGDTPRRGFRMADYYEIVARQRRGLERIHGCPPAIQKLIDDCMKPRREGRIHARELVVELTRLRSEIIRS